MSDPKPDSRRTDQWNQGATYEPYVGRWSRLVAREFIHWLRLPAGSRWLDVGSGTGALSDTILRAANPGAVQGVDPSAAFIAYAREQLVDERIRFEIGDAQALPFKNSVYDAVVAGLVLNFVPDKTKALSEMARVAKPGGVVGAYVWDYAGQMQMIRYFWDAVTALHPEAAELDEGRRFPICNPESLGELFRSNGLEQVEVRSIDVATHFQNFDDYWTPFLGGQGPAPSYLMGLNEKQRADLRSYLQAHLPKSPDGTIALVARAWAVRSRRPVEP